MVSVVGASLLSNSPRIVGSEGRVLGVDIADQVLDVARQKLWKEHLENRVALICADAITVPYPSGSLDTIFCSFTLELFDTLRFRVLAEWQY